MHDGKWGVAGPPSRSRSPSLRKLGYAGLPLLPRPFRHGAPGRAASRVESRASVEVVASDRASAATIENCQHCLRFLIRGIDFFFGSEIGSDSVLYFIAANGRHNPEIPWPVHLVGLSAGCGQICARKMRALATSFAGTPRLGQTGER